MADAADDGSATSTNIGGVTPNDAKFLVECLKNSRGPVSVDVEKVAGALGLTNPKSVSNRLGQIKKKYGMEFTTAAAAGVKTGTDVAGSPVGAGRVRKPATPKTPRTPKTGRVAKKEEGTPSRKGKGKTAKPEEKVDEDNNVEDDEKDGMMKAQDHKGETTESDEDGPATEPSEAVVS